MREKLFVIIFFLTVAVCSAHAETIYLKDGRVVKGKIINRGPYDITVQEGVMPRNYYNEQILRIEPDQPEALAKPGALTSLDPSKFPGIAPEKVSLIFEFMEASGVRRGMQSNIDQIIAQAPEEKREQVKAIFDLDAIIAQLVPVYDKYYTSEELTQITAFYKTPAGQKLIEATPKIMLEALQVIIDHFKQSSAGNTP